MTKAELDSKPLADLHRLAAEAGISRYRMLSRAELIDQLSGSDGKSGGEEKGREGRSDRGGGRQRQPRRRSRSRQGGERAERAEASRAREPRPKATEPKREREEPSAPPPPRAEPAAEQARPKRKRRRRWRRRGRKALRVHDLLLPPSPGRQAVVHAASKEECTALLREVAGELADASQGPDPIALLVDPSPEELADWRREVPQAEIVAAGQARHADDAIAQAARRAEAGEDVIVLIDSLTRFAEAYGGADAAKELFDAGRASQGGRGSLTVVAAVEKTE